MLRILSTFFIIAWFCLSSAFAPENAIAQDDRMRQINSRMPAPLQIDAERVEAAGIRRIDGRHCAFYTDIRDDPLVDELPGVFDAAVSQWCDYFDIPLASTDGWKVSGFIMQDNERFRQAGLFPADLPQFPTGYNRGHEFWVYKQQGDYYTRHLVIHEGTHAFMQWFLGGSGSPFFSEGMAELLALHSWDGTNLVLESRPRGPEDAAYWGRPKVFRKYRETGEFPGLVEVFATPPISFQDVENYAWSWAACRFLSRHPLSVAEFEVAKTRCGIDPTEFNVRLELGLSENLPVLERDWMLYLYEQDYGYEISRGVPVPAAELTPAEVENASDEVDLACRIKSDTGWQVTTLELAEGQTIQIEASGRFVVGNSEDGPWISEANGITIDYYRGHPLGILLAGTLSNDGSIAGLIDGEAIGIGGSYTATSAGRLCLRINDSPARMDDNEGELVVLVKSGG
ncbi:MAG: hypothetical protein AAF456_03035 [Planctomycetota bacterium]